MFILDIFWHLFEFVVDFFREIGQFFLAILRTPEAWFLLALFALSSAAAAAYFAVSIVTVLAVITGLFFLAWLLLALISPHKFFVVAASLLGLGVLAGFVFPQIREYISAFIFDPLYFVASFWWLILFRILFPMVEGLWIHWRQELFKEKRKLVMLELRMPRLVTQTPQAMEQVFTALHALRNSAGNLQEIYVDGEVTEWFSLEMVSFGGQISFYIRAKAKQRNLIEAAFFSYYQDVEIVEVEDYIDKLPKTVGEAYQQNYDLWGAEMSLAKEDAYPIKTYPLFETPDPEKRLDPISAFLEILGKLKEGEFVGIQFNIAPADKSWVKEWGDLLKKLKEPNAKKDDDKPSFVVRTPGETDLLKAVEGNLSKPAFDTIIRLIYISPKDIYFDTFARRGLIGAFNQYATLDLNSFKGNSGMTTRAQIWDYPHVFAGIRTEYKKQRLLHLYRTRDVPPEQEWGRWYMSYLFNSGFHSQRFKLTTEALATLFHPPTEYVLTAPHIKRVESRKAGPPAGLAIYGEEESLEKYYDKK